MLLKLAEIFVEASRKDYMRQYMASRYHQKRQDLINELGGKCSKCSTTDGPWHIDHINAKKKTMRAADIHSVSEKRLNKEKKNFQLLCETCHKQKTKETWDYATPKPKHGTYWMYRKHSCRCDKCKKAYKDTLKKWNDKRK